jgi:hypothetical protein
VRISIFVHFFDCNTLKLQALEILFLCFLRLFAAISNLAAAFFIFSCGFLHNDGWSELHQIVTKEVMRP